MTASELKSLLQERFGIQDNWPPTFVVDAETYANICQSIFDTKIIMEGLHEIRGGLAEIPIIVGPVKNGIMFKNVELIIRHDHTREQYKQTITEMLDDLLSKTVDLVDKLKKENKELKENLRRINSEEFEG